MTIGGAAMVTDSIATMAAADEQRQSRRAWVMLVALSLAFACSTLDRIVISLLVEPIKADLGLTDTQFSLLQGLAFLLVYSLSGILIGLLVDRINRCKLIGVGVALWSLMTGLCGLARSFWQLFLARAGVGIGEATLSPAAFSLIVDMFPRSKHGVALGLYSAGGVIGGCLALMAGGTLISSLAARGVQQLPIIGAVQPWQMTFFLLTLPGLVIAAIFFVLREPTRTTGVASPTAGYFDNPQLRAFYATNKSLLLRHHVAVGLCNLGLLGALSWLPSLFIRVHGWDVGDIGIAAGLCYMAGGLAGLIGGGAVGDYVLRFGPATRLTICAISTAGAAVCAVIYPLADSPHVAMVAFGGFMMCGSLPLGVANAALQMVVHGSIRGVVSSIYYLVLSLVAILGPTLIAVLADRVFPEQTGIRYATAIVLGLTAAVSTALFLWVTPAYRRRAASAARA